MKKLIPFIYVAMMYVTALSLGTLIHPGYLAYFLVVLLIMAVANMINAFRFLPAFYVTMHWTQLLIVCQVGW